MASIRVKDNVFIYKNTYFQIAQINSIRVFEKGKIKVRNEQEIVRKEKFKISDYMGIIFLLFFSLVGGMVALINSRLDFSVIPFVICILAASYLAYKYSTFEPIVETIPEEYKPKYVISLRMAGGESYEFMTPNQEHIYSVRNGILQVMNKEKGVNVNFNDENAEINILDANNVEINN
ncbi:MAG: hypothetical protein D3910_22480 [Candidatus Electrothrix sp. ATG2]|nr:hypothetical protein [Candidatus Electrothrix sp. ATG2]